VKGVLEYTKLPPENGEDPCVVHVKVSGTVHGTLPLPDSDITLNNSVSGEQTYDTKIKQWIAGKLDLAVSSSQKPGAKISGSMGGNMKLSMKMEKEVGKQ
jgi:hypothetical protein